MIAFISGKVDSIDENSVVVDTGGIGCRAYMSPASLGRLAIGEPTKIYTYLRVGEDFFDLYGFLTPEELKMFKMIISVSGAGPKAGLSVLSVLSPAQFALAVVTDDAKSITRAQGVGPKLAQKIILELRDKLQNAELLEDSARAAVGGTVGFGAAGGSEAAEALVVLGYSAAEAAQAISGLPEGLSTEDTIKEALKRLMK